MARGVESMFHRAERLFLRPGFAEDWQAIHAALAHADMVRNLATAPWPYQEADAQAFVLRPQDKVAPHFLVTLPGAGIIGSAGLGYEGVTGEVQLGYWIAREHWGRGYATEAARGVLAVARAIGHRRIVASHFLDNPASGKVLEKAGFCPTGEIRPGYSVARGGHDPVVCFDILLGSACGSEVQDALQQAA